jgi:hypothetical protein
MSSLNLVFKPHLSADARDLAAARGGNKAASGLLAGDAA